MIHVFFYIHYSISILFILETHNQIDGL